MKGNTHSHRAGSMVASVTRPGQGRQLTALVPACQAPPQFLDCLENSHQGELDGARCHLEAWGRAGCDLPACWLSSSTAS